MHAGRVEVPKRLFVWICGQISDGLKEKWQETKEMTGDGASEWTEEKTNFWAKAPPSDRNFVGARQGHCPVLRFEARREQNGLPAVTIRELLKATLRHRPDRIIVGEIRGGEAFDLLQLLNTGHSGTLSTVHANSAAQGISRFTTCVLQSGVEMPYRAIKTNIADSLNIIIQIERKPGTRFVSEVLEIRGYEPGADRYDLYLVYGQRRDNAGD